MTDFKSNHWALLDLQQELLPTGWRFIATTDVPAHLYMRMSTVPPKKRVFGTPRRGIYLQGDVRFCFVVYEDNEQDEPGDTLAHTWNKLGWQEGETRWFYFIGTQAGTASVSETAIFRKTFYPPPPPPPSRQAFARQFVQYGATVPVYIGRAVAQGFWTDTPALLSHAYLFTTNNNDVDVVFSIRHVDAQDMPILPDLVSHSVNLSVGVLAGGSPAWPVYRHTATLPLTIAAATHFAVVVRPTTGTAHEWVTFRNINWDPSYDKDSGTNNYVVRWRISFDGGNTWQLAGAPGSKMNFEVYGTPIP